jgi:hypothetical protein
MLENLSASQQADLDSALFAGKRFVAVRTYVAATGASLRQAAIAVDKWAGELRSRSPDKFKPDAVKSAPPPRRPQRHPFQAEIKKTELPAGGQNESPRTLRGRVEKGNDQRGLLAEIRYIRYWLPHWTKAVEDAHQRRLSKTDAWVDKALEFKANFDRADLTRAGPGHLLSSARQTILLMRKFGFFHKKKFFVKILSTPMGGKPAQRKSSGNPYLDAPFGP